VRGLNAGYAALNVAFSVGWLALLHARRDPGFARERRAALGAFLGALPVFLAFPTAPPRTQEGYVDTLGEAGIDIEHPLLVRFYNPVAALPSQHAAFASSPPSAWRGARAASGGPPGRRTLRSWPSSSSRPRTTTCSTSPPAPRSVSPRAA
jgi:hypothetical protein